MIRDITNPKLYISGNINSFPRFRGIKKKFKTIIMIIDIEDKITVSKAGR